jgi:predicted nucleotidyltransferase
MTGGLSERTLTTLRRVLARYPEIERAVLYGSRAKGTHRPGSDIDLSLIGDAVDERTSGRVWGDLDASGVPVAVDVSAFNGLTSDELRDHIRRVGVVLYRREDGGDAPSPRRV